MDTCWFYSGYIYIHIYLVGGDWNMNFIFPYIGNNHPNWLIFFRGGSNHQPVNSWWIVDIQSIQWWMEGAIKGANLGYSYSLYIPYFMGSRLELLGVSQPSSSSGYIVDIFVINRWLKVVNSGYFLWLIVINSGYIVVNNSGLIVFNSGYIVG